MISSTTMKGSSEPEDLMPTTTRSPLVRICTLAITVLFLAAPAMASSLDDAKAAGLIGERPDGYVGLVVKTSPGGARKLVDDINTKRKAKYTEIAKGNSSSVAAVASQMGAKLINRAAKGTFVMDGSGKWMRK